ncbi:ArgE Acetylornithine deacetylase/Succinyl-diaminopimelate desuccinylase and related deacylases [Rhabdaerophilaceae bacterium]
MNVLRLRGMGMIAPDDIEQLFARIDAARDDLVQLTQDLIRFPTVNPPGQGYDECCQFLAERLTRHGAKVDLVRASGAPADSDAYPRWNVIGRFNALKPGPCVHFNGHIDVVEVGHGWTVPPFEGVVKDGRVYGRGACDMKGGIAASLIAIEALLSTGLHQHGALEFSGTADEESGGYGGVGYLARQGWFDQARVDHVIIPEPLNPDRVCLGHRGVWWAEIEMRGAIGHGAMPFLGVNAIAGMGDLIGLIETDLMPKLAGRITQMPCEPAGARQATLNYNSIHGGQPEPGDGLPAPVVADRARLVIDRRYLVEEEFSAVKGEINSLLERVKNSRVGIEASIREIMTFEPTMTAPDAPLVRALDHWIERLFDRPATHIASPGTYDQKHIAQHGSVRACVAYGPGILDLAHQPDEWVGIDDMLASAKVMAAAALTLLREPTRDA